MKCEEGDPEAQNDQASGDWVYWEKSLMTDEAKKLSFATKATNCTKSGHDTFFRSDCQVNESFWVFISVQNVDVTIQLKNHCFINMKKNDFRCITLLSFIHNINHTTLNVVSLHKGHTVWRKVIKTKLLLYILAKGVVLSNQLLLYPFINAFWGVTEEST